MTTAQHIAADAAQHLATAMQAAAEAMRALAQLHEQAEQRLHSIPAVAARIGVSPEYLREQCREGKQECYHIAGQYFLDDAQIVRFLKERRKDRKVKAKKGSESDATL